MRLLEDYKGYLQSDAYAGYDKPGRRDGVKHVGCLDRARRKFVEAVKASPRSPPATACCAAGAADHPQDLRDREARA